MGRGEELGFGGVWVQRGSEVKGERGLDRDGDRKLNVEKEEIATVYEGGPVGVEALAATIGEDGGTLEDVVEPFLLQSGFVARTRQGRRITRAGAEHIGAAFRSEQIDEKDDGPPPLFGG